MRVVVVVVFLVLGGCASPVARDGTCASFDEDRGALVRHDCADGLVCAITHDVTAGDEGECVPLRDRSAGEPCHVDDDCARSLTCEGTSCPDALISECFCRG
jgi:hypothetical protein